jgi:hypothetical protein
MISEPRKQITVTFTPQAKAEWCGIPEPIRLRLLAYIKENALRSHEAMVVSRLTWECPDHIYRAFKVYQVPPSWRIIFHHEGGWDSIVIDRIAQRRDDPYGDGK